MLDGPMQFVSTRVLIGDAQITFALGYARAAWAVLVERQGFVLDTRFVPAADAVARDRVCVYVLLRGRWLEHGPDGRSFEGRAAFVVSEAQLEGEKGRRSCTFRSDGAPLAAIELHLPRTHVAAPRGLLAPLALDDAAWSAATDALAALDGDRTDNSLLSERIPRLLRELSRLGIITPDAPVAATEPSPPALRRVLAPLQRTVERMYLGATLKELERATGTSPRQLARDVERAVRSLGLAGLGWRLTSRHLRIKFAVILLSAEHATVAEVARLIGWGSADAMTRAFRNAGLPAPSSVQRAIRASSPAGDGGA